MNGRVIVAFFLGVGAITVAAKVVGDHNGTPMTWEQAAAIGGAGAMFASLSAALVGL